MDVNHEKQSPLSKKVDITWPLAPHTKAKHEILKYYLGAWFPILATVYSRFLYTDGFAGPGEYDGGEDGSPIIALKVALQHKLKEKFQRPGRELVFIFIEKDKAKYQNLQRKLNEIQRPSNFKVDTRCESFEEIFKKTIIAQIEEQNTPSFVFIDPFGPTGFPMTLFTRLAKQPSAETLINFQYQSLNQWFLKDPSKHRRLTELYGDERWRQALNIPNAQKKENYLRESYKEALEELGWKVRSFRMENKHHQTQYYLFYTTRNWRGNLEMKRAMWKAAPEGDFEYSDLTDSQQLKLFSLSKDEEYAKELADQLYQTYEGRTVLKETLLKDDVAWHSTCVERHLTRALKILEYESSLSKITGVQLPNNKKRRKGTYSKGCSITFQSYLESA